MQLERVTIEAVRAFRIGEKTYYPARPAELDDKGKEIAPARAADRVEVDINTAADVVNTKRARRVS